MRIKEGRNANKKRKSTNEREKDAKKINEKRGKEGIHVVGQNNKILILAKFELPPIFTIFGIYFFVTFTSQVSHVYYYKPPKKFYV